MYSRQKDLDELRAELERIESVKHEPLTVNDVSKSDTKKVIQNIKLAIVKHEELAKKEQIEADRIELLAKAQKQEIADYDKFVEFNQLLTKAYAIASSLKGIGNYRPGDWTKFDRPDYKNALLGMIQSSQRGIDSIGQLKGK